MTDYIKREDAINAIDVDNVHRGIIDALHSLIREIPAADVRENKHGEWIGYPECLKYPNAYSDDHIVCSNCEECFSILDNCTERFDFCPHCGAIMDGVSE